MNSTDATDVRTIAEAIAKATGAEKRALRAELNAAVLMHVQAGESKHDVANDALLAYSTVNDICRRAAQGVHVGGASFDRKPVAVAAPVVTYTGRSIEALREQSISIDSLTGVPTEAQREANRQKAKHGANGDECPICASPVAGDAKAGSTMIHMSTDWRILPADLTDEEQAHIEAAGFSQGSFVIGARCARKVPKAFRSTVA